MAALEQRVDFGLDGSQVVQKARSGCLGDLEEVEFLFEKVTKSRGSSRGVLVEEEEEEEEVDAGSLVFGPGEGGDGLVLGVGLDLACEHLDYCIISAGLKLIISMHEYY